MTPSAYPSPSTDALVTSFHTDTRLRTQRTRPARGRRLATYTDSTGSTREIVTRAAAAGTMLVLDRDARTRADRRLLAHLAADEPAVNADHVCRDYLRDAHLERRRCRPVTHTDVLIAGACESAAHELELRPRAELAPDSLDVLGRRYRLERVGARMSIPELRWLRLDAESRLPGEIVSLREVIARLESYEPMRTLTMRAIAGAGNDRDVSTTTIRAELARVLDSPIVLNRGLRGAVLARVAQGNISMSEIAIRCRRVKRDGRGNVSGETSWLARRLGLLREGGQHAPTPWIHIDVLALIARDGLGIAPWEVEI